MFNYIDRHIGNILYISTFTVTIYIYNFYGILRFKLSLLYGAQEAQPNS